MKKLLLLTLFIALPVVTHASTVLSSRTLVVAEPVDGNAYIAGTDVSLTAPQKGDVLGVGATISDTARVGGDLMLAGGTVIVREGVVGDARIVGGRIDLTAPVGGDLFLAGGTITASTSASFAHVAGGTVSLSGAFTGPVKVYGGDVTISGTYRGDVTVAASDHISVLPGTVITGTLSYNAPEQIALPEDVQVLGGVEYTGSSVYLPTNEEAKRFAIAGASVLFIVHLLALLILAGLAAGLFGTFTERLAERAIARPTSQFVLLVLLGFGMLIATPVLILLLLLSFVGIGVAFFILLTYLLAIFIAYIYAGILTGTLLARKFLHRSVITWKEAVVGMMVFYLIGAVPFFGPLVKGILILASLGALTSLFYTTAFKREEESYE